MHSQAIEGAKADKLFGSFLNIHVVTLDWLKDSFMKEQRMTEIKYFPIETKVNGKVHSERAKVRKSYPVTKNIFMGDTFAIRAESFTSLDESSIQKMEKAIIQNGGHIKEDPSEAKFLVQEDGFDPEIW
jgi:hypothetical protein